MLRRTLCLAALATAAAAKAKADPKECEVCIANLEAIDKLIDKDEKTSKQSIMEAITKHLPRVLVTPSTTPSMRRRSCDGVGSTVPRWPRRWRTVVTPPERERHTTSLITARSRRHCGDLQNEQPNPALNARDRKMCYYFEPIRAAIAQPFSTRLCGNQNSTA